ncbi:MAG TPA: hypothetical protein VGD08_22905 [Stellaceae bacterium]
MIVELQMTAIHEAAHITLAVLSRFHELSFGWIRLTLGARGEAPFVRSGPKLRACGKDNRTSRRDKEVAREAVAIYLAGLLAERRLCERYPEYAADFDETASAHDLASLQAELAAAGIDAAEIDMLTSAAERAVTAHWDTLTLLARAMLHSGGWEIHPSRAEEIVQRHACGYWSIPGAPAETGQEEEAALRT